MALRSGQKKSIRYFDNLVVQVDGDKSYYYVFRYTPTEEWLTSGKGQGSYSGEVHIFDFNTGGRVGSLKMQNGVETSPTNEGKVCQWEYTGEFNCTTLNGYQYCYYKYSERCGGGDGSSGGDFGNPSHEGDPDPFPTDPAPGGGPGGGFNSGGPGDIETNPIIDDDGDLIEVECLEGEKPNIFGICEEVEEDRIKNELDDPCANAIFTELENGSLEQKLKQTMNPETNIFITFHQSILNLFNESSSTHLTILNGNTDSNAFTVNTTITMGNGYLANATELSIARTMIHESIHAYINGLYYSDSSFHDKSFRDKLRIWAGDNGYSNWDVIHHEFMGGYVDAIAISLLQWDTDYGTGGNLGWDYYQSMAFAGLVNKKMDENGNPILDSNGNFTYEDTDSFKDLVPNENERDEIKKINIDEATGNSDSQGTECD